MTAAQRLSVFTFTALAAVFLGVVLSTTSLAWFPTPSFSLLLRPVSVDAPKVVAETETVTHEPTTLAPVTLYAGPFVDEYDILAMLPEGSAVLVTGRDESGDWLAIALSPNLNGWAPAVAIANAPDAGRLPVAKVARLRSFR